MSKTLITTDWHIGARSGSKHFREYFRRFLMDVFIPFVKDKNNDIEAVIHAGDMFDNRSSLTLPDIGFMMNEFIPAYEKLNIPMYVIAGNHDIAYRNTNEITSLSLLKNTKNFIVIKDKVEKVDVGSQSFVLCPWINGENYSDFMKGISKYRDENSVLIGHFELEGFRMYKNAKINDNGLDSKLLHGFHKVYSGHFHHPSKVGNIEYIGSQFFLTWQDVFDERGSILFDNETQETKFIENNDSLFQFIDYHDDKLLELSEDKNKLLKLVGGKIVKINIDDDYNRVDFKEVLSKIEKLKPIDVAIVDNTIVEKNEFSKAMQESSDIKTTSLSEYAVDYFSNDSNKEELTSLFDNIYKEALEKVDNQ